jgi:hypothetical protein
LDDEELFFAFHGLIAQKTISGQIFHNYFSQLIDRFLPIFAKFGRFKMLMVSIADCRSQPDLRCATDRSHRAAQRGARGSKG